MHKRILIFLMGCLLLIGAVACTRDTFQAGRPITKEELLSMSEALFTEAPEPDVIYPEGTVHWTAGGSVYHTHADCSHLRRSKEILHGTLDEAIDAGKDKICSSCEKKQE